MKCGFSTKALTFPLPIPLAGYAAKRIAGEIHDPLCVQILVIQNEDAKLGLISMDLVGIEAHFYFDLMRMAKPYGFDEANLMIGATHTHSGIQGVMDCEHSDVLKGMDFIFGSWKEEVASPVIKVVEACLKEALASMESGQIRMIQDNLEGIGSNRNNPSLPGDPEVFMLEVKQTSGKAALLYRLACHPTVLDPNNKQVSADIPGAVRKRLREKYDTVLFMNGSCGDISTRFTRVMSGFDEVERYGERIASAILSCTADFNGKAYDTVSLHHYKQKITLQTKSVMGVDQAQQQLKAAMTAYEAAKQQGISGARLRVLATHVEGKTANVFYAKRGCLTKSIAITVYYLQLNDELLLFCPLELYSQLSNRIKRPHLHVIGYANGYALYLTDEEAHDKQYYEALISPFARGEGERFLAEVEAFVQNLLK